MCMNPGRPRQEQEQEMRWSSRSDAEEWPELVRVPVSDCSEAHCAAFIASPHFERWMEEWLK